MKQSHEAHRHLKILIGCEAGLQYTSDQLQQMQRQVRMDRKVQL